jgi:hypothetical protein
MRIDALLKRRARDRLSDLRFVLNTKYQDVARQERLALRASPTLEAELTARRAMNEFQREIRTLPPLLRDFVDVETEVEQLHQDVLRVIDDITNPGRSSEFEVFRDKLANHAAGLVGLL